MHLVNHDVWMKDLRAKLPVLRSLHDAAQVVLVDIAAEDWPSAAGKSSLSALRDYADGLLKEWDRTDLNRKNLILNRDGDGVDADGHFIDADGQLIPAA